MRKIESKKLTLNRESLRLLNLTEGMHLIAEMPETVVGHSCDSCAY
jgi:phosphatidate phosphatase PAH1